MLQNPKPLKNQKPTLETHWIYEWEEESAFFEHGNPYQLWCPGSDCYIATYEAWIPKSIQEDDEDEIHNFININIKEPWLILDKRKIK